MGKKIISSGIQIVERKIFRGSNKNARQGFDIDENCGPGGILLTRA
jgi:hypothetical protein